MKTLLTIFLLLTSSPYTRAAERVALVIGNNSYPGNAELHNPRRDAESVTKLLSQCGFKVLPYFDVTTEKFYEALTQFKSEASGAKVGLIYYSGHGLEFENQNYLLGVNAMLNTQSQLETQAVSVGKILEAMSKTKLPAKMLILDCCRSTPSFLKRDWLTTRSGGGGAGLAEVPDVAVPPSTMILFAAAPNENALDGPEGGNSPFTAALVGSFGKKGVSAFDAFRSVSLNVRNNTEKRQNPWLKFDGAGAVFSEFNINPTKKDITITSDPVVPPSPASPPLNTGIAGRYDLSIDPDRAESGQGSITLKIDAGGNVLIDGSGNASYTEVLNGTKHFFQVKWQITGKKPFKAQSEFKGKPEETKVSGKFYLSEQAEGWKRSNSQDFQHDRGTDL